MLECLLHERHWAVRDEKHAIARLLSVKVAQAEEILGGQHEDVRVWVIQARRAV
jgi:hypothetical protein